MAVPVFLAPEAVVVVVVFWGFLEGPAVLVVLPVFIYLKIIRSAT